MTDELLKRIDDKLKSQAQLVSLLASTQNELAELLHALKKEMKNDNA